MINWLQVFLGFVEELHFLPLIYMNKLILGDDVIVSYGRKCITRHLWGVFTLPSILRSSGFKHQLMHYFDALGYWIDYTCISILVAIFTNDQQWHLQSILSGCKVVSHNGQPC